MIPMIPADITGAAEVLIYLATAVAAFLSVVLTAR